MNERDIELAEQASHQSPDGYPVTIPYSKDFAEKFAALIRADERERIKAANAPEIERINTHLKSLEDAVKAEREACAKVCEDLAAAYQREHETARENGADSCAIAILARGNT